MQLLIGPKVCVNYALVVSLVQVARNIVGHANQVDFYNLPTFQATILTNPGALLANLGNLVF